MTAVLPQGDAGDRSGHKEETFNEEKKPITGLEETSKFSIPPT